MALHRWRLGPCWGCNLNTVRFGIESPVYQNPPNRTSATVTVVDATHRRLAKNIRARARELDIPLTHVADRAGVGRANFWTVLKGTSSPTLKWIVKVAATLQCDAAELLRR